MITDKIKELVYELSNYKPEEGDSDVWAKHTIKQLKEEIDNSKKLFCYSKPNVMDGYLQNGDCHNYTDDVAICYAEDINEANKIFEQLYDKGLLEGNIREVTFNNYGVFIATDY